MGPLFTVLFSAVALALVWVVAFVCARSFQSTVVAVRLASLFVVGAVAGVMLSVVGLKFFIGAGDTLTSSGQVIMYLSSLAAGGFIGGGSVIWFYRVLTLRSSGTAQKRAAP